MKITDLVRKGAKQVSRFKNICFISLFSSGGLARPQIQRRGLSCPPGDNLQVLTLTFPHFPALVPSVQSAVALFLHYFPLN